MGIPKFYRWTSERYPCLYEKIREYQIPEFDNLYLDMNGIIHNCSHPNDEDVHLRIPEENIFKDIFHYIDFLFRMIKPCRVFFMAIDGVAPRAKMNQQRGRRFRSARLAEEQEAEAIRQGEKLPSEERFDSNCITPGTDFMARLHEQLKYFVSVKVSTDPLWQRKGLCVYLSGHDVPGEGEHKIMDFIRHIRSEPEYDPDTRHCLYGLDADLMMLGLSTHELRFSLLREEVKFSRPKKKKPAKNPPQKKSKQKDSNEIVTYDLTNVSVFTSESALDNIDSVLKPPMCVGNAANFPNVIDKSFVEAVNLIANSPSKNNKIDVDVSAVNKPILPAINAGIPPPPASDDHNAKGDYKAPLPEKTTFFLLHLSLFRDYLDEEFQELQAKLRNHRCIKYDLECVIDDWILMNILVGNDFVPHLPNLHIVKGALPMLYRTYMDILPTLDGYLNENGILNLNRFEVFIRKLSQFDLDMFRETYDDMKYKASKTGKNIVLGEKMFEDFIFEDDTPFEEEDLQPVSDELKELARRTEDEIFGDMTSVDGQGTLCKEVFPEDNDFFAPDDTEEFRLEFLQHKRNYYLTKCEFKKVDRYAVFDFSKEFVRAIQWVLLYYYKGVSSWGWFYPSHFGPFASDLRNFRDYKIEFNKGQPFKPFEQLLAVLPSQSKRLLPACYQWLMTEADSPILEYYPKKFEQDLNGKKQDWEAVVLIPFIDESKLLGAMEREALKLSEEEVFRNARGSLLCYSHTSEATGPVKSHRNLFPELEVSHIKLIKINEVTYNPALLPKGLHQKADVKKIYQGFPSLKSKTFNSCVCKAEVKVFEFYAREESLILSFEDFEDKEDGLKLGKKILGKSVWVNWPHLESALVSAVHTRSAKYVLGRDNLVIKDPRCSEDAAKKTFDVMAKGLIERHLKFRGIRLGTLNVIIMARLMEGRKVRCNQIGKVVIENQWSKVEQPFALKTAIHEERVTEMFYMDNETAKSYLDLFRKGDQVIYLGDKLFGAMGVVVGHDKGNGSVVVNLTYPKNVDESNLKLKTGLKQLKSQDFFPPYVTAAKCQISSFALSRLTGRVLVSVEKVKKPSKRSSRFKKTNPTNGGSLSGSNSSESGPDEDFPVLEPEIQKFNVGLDLKFNKTNMEVRGYTTKREGQWFYSANVVKLVNEYASKFPDVVALLGRADKSKDVYSATELFTEDPQIKTMEIVQWLEDRGVKDLPRIPTNCNVLDDDDIDLVWKHVTTVSSKDANDEKKWTARPNLLYKPGLDKGCVAPVPNAQFALLDRVICVDRGASIPLGIRGTVVGIQAPPKNNNDNSDEAFKSVSSDALNALIVMCDPAPDIFDDPNAGMKGKGELTELTGSLAKLLGVGGLQQSTDNQNGCSAIKNTQSYQQTKPKLVKLFPYQVINLTQGASDLRQDLKKAPVSLSGYGNIDKPGLRNGTVIVPLDSTQVVGRNSNRYVNPSAAAPVKVLQRFNANKREVEQMPEIPSMVPKENHSSTKKKDPLMTLPWPPQPMNRSITVEQLFAQAKAQQMEVTSQVEVPKSKPLQKLRNTQLPKTNSTAEIIKSSNVRSTRPEETLGKRHPAFIEQNDKRNHPNAQKQRVIPTQVFVNSSLHPKAKDTQKTSENATRKPDQTPSSTNSSAQETNKIINLLCQPKNVERVNTSYDRNNDQLSSNGYSLPPDQVQRQTHPQFSHVNFPGMPDLRLINPINPGAFSHPVMFVNAQQDFYVPTPYPVMPGRNVYASAFIPQPHQQFTSMPVHATMFAPPPPPQHWTHQSGTSAANQQPYQQFGGNQPTFRQMKGTHKSNVFVPLQVSRSMASGDSEFNVPFKHKPSTTETEIRNPTAISQPTPPRLVEDSTAPAASTLKALLGLTPGIQPDASESIPSVGQQKKSRIAANFFGNQNQTSAS